MSSNLITPQTDVVFNDNMIPLCFNVLSTHQAYKSIYETIIDNIFAIDTVIGQHDVNEDMKCGIILEEIDASSKISRNIRTPSFISVLKHLYGEADYCTIIINVYDDIIANMSSALLSGYLPYQWGKDTLIMKQSMLGNKVQHNYVESVSEEVLGFYRGKRRKGNDHDVF